MISRTAVVMSARTIVPSRTPARSARATSTGPGAREVSASLDAAAQMATRIASAASPRSHPRIVRLLSRDLLHLAGDATPDSIGEHAHAFVGRRARARQIDGLL